MVYTSSQAKGSVKENIEISPWWRPSVKYLGRFTFPWVLDSVWNVMFSLILPKLVLKEECKYLCSNVMFWKQLEDAEIPAPRIAVFY
jgi:hypothetical protein